MDAGARVIHVDVMDGHFVPPITIGPLVAGSIADQVHDAGGAIDVHLMIEAPERQIEAFAEAGADSITFHAEATPHANRTLSAIRELGCLAGVAINPGTPVEAVSELRGPRRHRPLHDRQPRLGRSGLHRVLAGQGRPPRARWSATPRSRSTAASTPRPPARSPRPAPPSSSPAPPSSAPPTRRRLHRDGCRYQMRRGQADQGRRERGVLRTRATEDADMRRATPRLVRRSRLRRPIASPAPPASRPRARPRPARVAGGRRR